MHRSFVDNTTNTVLPVPIRSSPDLPLPENYLQYRQEVPVSFSQLPPNISPPQIYEQYSMPVEPYFVQSTPRKIIRGNPSMVLKSTPGTAGVISNPRVIENSVVARGNSPIVNLSPGRRVLTPGRRVLSPGRTVLTPVKRSDGLIEGFKMEIERLTFLLREKEEELKSYMRKCIHLEGHLSEKGQSTDINPRIRDLEDKLNLLLLENQKLNHLLNDKEMEVESWRTRNSHFEMTVQDAKVLSARIKDLELRNGSLLEELEKWKMNYYEGERSRTKEEQVKRSAVKEKESAESEIKNLRNTIKSRETEIEELRLKMRQLEGMNRDGRNLEQRLVILSGDNEKLQRVLHDKTSEYEMLKQKNYTLETTLHEFKMKQDMAQELENRVALLSSEISRLNSLIKDRNEEIESLRMRYSKLEYSTREVNVFESELRRTRELLELRNREVQEWKAKCIKLEGSINDLKSSQVTLRENKDRISIYLADIERLNNTIRAKNQEIERLEFSLNNKKVSDSELFSREQNERKIREIEDLRMRCKSLENLVSEGGRNNEIIFELENKIAMLSTELERVNQILRNKSEEVENLKIKGSRIEPGFEVTREWQAKVDFLNSEIMRLNGIIQSLEIESNRFTNMNGSMSKNFEQDELIQVLSRENEDLRQALYERDVEISNLRRGKFRYN